MIPALGFKNHKKIKLNSKKINPYSLKSVKKYVDWLITHHPNSFSSAKEWFEIFHDLSCQLSQAYSQLEINYSLNNSKYSEDKITKFEQEILSFAHEQREKILKIYLDSPFRTSMHSFDNYKIFNELKRKENIFSNNLGKLLIKENSIIREYKNFITHLNYKNKNINYLYSVLSSKLNSDSEEQRKEYFYYYWDCLKNNSNYFQTIFDKLIEVREEQSNQLNLPYIQYKYIELSRFDYTQNDIKKFRNSIAKVLPNFILKFIKNTFFKEKFFDDILKPWNLGYSNIFRPKLKQEESSNIHNTISLILKNIHPSFEKTHSILLKNSKIDIYSRENKSPGAFSIPLHATKESFLFGNFSYNFKDILTYIHEFGHTFHACAFTQIDNILLREPPLEFCEIASTGLEILSSKHFEKICDNKEEADRAIIYLFFNILNFLPFAAAVDEWQEEIYEKKIMNWNSRNKLWKELSKKYRPYISWGKYDVYEEYGWMTRPHFFQAPFYYIEYAIAYIGVLQLWLNSFENYDLSVEKYIRSLSLGGQISLKDLFTNIGSELNFDENFINDLITNVSTNILKNHGHT